MSLSGFGQLSHRAEQMKRVAPERFEQLVESAKDKWGSDYQMQLFEVNKQSKAFMTIAIEITKSKEDPVKRQILTDAFVKWRVNETVVEWDMVLYEYNKQLEAYQTMGL